jgi:hypothetical protein
MIWPLLILELCGPIVSAMVQNNNSTDPSAIMMLRHTPMVTLEHHISDPAYQRQASTDNGTTWTDVTGATP